MKHRLLSRRQVLGAAAALSVPALLARPSQAMDLHLRVGAILPIGGSSMPTSAENRAEVAEIARTGLVMSEEELNLNASLFGNSVKLLTANAPSPDAAARAAQRLVEHDGATVLIGGFSRADAEAISEVANSAGAVFLNIAAMSDALRTSCQPFTFHVEASAAMYLDALAGWFVRAGFRNWYIVHEDSDEGAALLARARVSLGDRHWGARIAGTSAVPEAGYDFEATVRNIASATPDVVLLLNDRVSQVEFLSRYNAAGLPHPVTMLPEAGAQTRRHYAAAVRAASAAGAGHRAALWEPTLDAYGARELNARFAARWGRPMDSAAWAGFQAMKIAFEGAQFGGGADAASIAAFLARKGSVFDVHKGIGCSFRPWDHQLRQSLYLVKVNADAPPGMRVQELNARADLVGELPAIYMPGTDPVERLDQLGDTTPGTACAPT